MEFSGILADLYKMDFRNNYCIGRWILLKKPFVQSEHQTDDGVQPILPCVWVGWVFCAHTHMLIQMFLDEKAKLNYIKLLRLSWALMVWFVCTLKCTWKNRYIPKTGLIQCVLLPWFYGLSQLRTGKTWTGKMHIVFLLHMYFQQTQGS